MPQNESVDLNVGAAFPGESVAVALLTYATKYREGMSQENKDLWDRWLYVQAKGWNNWWVKNAQWPGETIP